MHPLGTDNCMPTTVCAPTRIAPDFTPAKPGSLSSFRNLVLSLVIIGLFPFATAAAPFIYVTNTPGVSVIDATTNGVVANVPGINTGFLHGVSFSPDGKRAYVANNFNASVEVIDTATYTLVATIPVAQNPRAVGVTSDGALAYVVTDAGTILVITTATNTVTSTISVPPGGFFFSIVMSPDGIHAYVVDLHGAVLVLNTTNNTVEDRIPFPGTSPQWGALTPDAKKLYLVVNPTSTVAVLDTATKTVTHSIPVSGTLRAVAVSPDGKRAYVTSENGAVFVIDTATDSVVTTIGTPQVRGITVTPDSKKVYAASPSGSVVVIDAETNKVTTGIPMDFSPVQIGVPTTLPKVPPPTVPLTVARIMGNKGGNSGSVSVSILGTGFVEGTTARLRMAGAEDISGSDTEVTSAGSLLTTFNLNGRAIGTWDVVVTRPDGASATLPGAFTVEQSRAGLVWTELVGRREIRPGRQQTYYLSYGNKGNTDAYGVPIWLAGIPKDAAVSLGFDITPPPGVDGAAPPDLSQYPTVLQTESEQIVPLLLPVVPAGQTQTLKISITLSPQTTIGNFVLLRSWASAPMFSEAAPQAQALDAKMMASQVSLNISSDCIAEGKKFLLDKALGKLFSELLELTGERAIPLPKDCINQALVTIGKVIVSAIKQYRGMNNSPLVLSYSQLHSELVKTVLLCAKDIFATLPPVKVTSFVIEVTIKVAEFLSNANDLLDLANACVSAERPRPNELPVKPVSSFDPNDITGLTGAGTARFVTAESSLLYTIFFENKSTATAPAQDVVITSRLDPAKFDFSTFSFGPFAFGDRLVLPAPGLTEFTKDVDLRPGKNLIVRVTGKLKTGTGDLEWKFASLDPATLAPTEDPQAGFLPPNRQSPEGEGNVVFSVSAKKGLENGATLLAKARIVFDTNAPIDTPEWLNTIDDTKPSSQVLPLAPAQSNASFEVTWGGTDTGSGVGGYTVFVSEAGGPFTAWLQNTQATSAVFNGQPDTTYAFYTVAQDAAGNIEPTPAGPDASTATPPIAVAVQESAYSIPESNGRFEITVLRSGRSGAFTLNYKTSDGTASERSDYTATAGTLRFAAGEMSKVISIPITNDVLSEPNETLSITLSDPTGGAGFGANSSAVLTITDDDTVDGVSPVRLGASFGSEFFVRQHYLDFLNREPDASGLSFWTGNFTECGANAQCVEVKRINVSAAFFLSIEFQQTGYLSYRARKAAFGNLPGKPVPVTRDEMLHDMRAVGEGVVVGAQGWEQLLEQNKQAYFDQLAGSARFAALYPQSLTPEQFVGALDTNAGGALSQAERDALVSDLKSGAKSRAQVLRAVAEDADLTRAEFNKAFVLMQYFGYLRRNPDDLPDKDFSGWQFWLGKLNQFKGNFIEAEMVKAFLDSIEYQQRFGQ